MIDHFDSMIKYIYEIINYISTDMELVDLINKHSDIHILPSDPFTFGDSVELLHDEIEEIMKYFLEDISTLNSSLVKNTDVLNDKNINTSNFSMTDTIKLKYEQVYEE